MEKVYGIISKLSQFVLNPIITILFGVALVIFLYGVLEYLWKSRSDPAAITAGAKHIGWGLLGMFIMFSVFGFIQIILNTLPVDSATKENVKKVIPLN